MGDSSVCHLSQWLICFIFLFLPVARLLVFNSSSRMIFCGWLHSCECASRGPTQNELGVLYWFSSSEFLPLSICVAEFFLFSFLQCVL